MTRLLPHRSRPALAAALTGVLPAALGVLFALTVLLFVAPDALIALLLWLALG